MAEAKPTGLKEAIAAERSKARAEQDKKQADSDKLRKAQESFTSEWVSAIAKTLGLPLLDSKETEDADITLSLQRKTIEQGVRLSAFVTKKNDDAPDATARIDSLGTVIVKDGVYSLNNPATEAAIAYIVNGQEVSEKDLVSAVARAFA